MKAQRLTQKWIIYETIENIQEIIWSKIGSAVKSFIKGFIEKLLEDEITAAVGALRYERSSERKAYRNGHYQRNLLTNNINSLIFQISSIVVVKLCKSYWGIIDFIFSSQFILKIGKNN